MADTINGKIARKYMAHYIDASFGGETADYYRLGEDLEEFNVELNPDTETSKNILGESSFKHNGYEPSANAEPFYAKVGDALFEKLQQIVDEQITDDGLRTTAVEVHLWKSETGENTFEAYRQPCYVVPISYGGDTSGYQIPFTVNYVGGKTKGTFKTDTGVFTAQA